MDDNHLDSEILVQFVDGRLPADQRRQVAHHLARCRECSLVYLALHAAQARLAQPAPYRPSPADQRVLRELMARYRGSPARRTLRRWGPMVAAAAAVLLLACGFWGWHQYRTEPPRRMAISPAPQPEELTARARPQLPELVLPQQAMVPSGPEVTRAVTGAAPPKEAEPPPRPELATDAHPDSVSPTLGKVRFVAGNPTVVSEDQTYTAEPGSLLKSGYLLRTGAVDRIVIELPDRGQLMVNFDTTVRLNRAAHSKGTGLQVDLVSGQLWAWSPGDGRPIQATTQQGTATVHRAEAIISVAQSEDSSNGSMQYPTEVVALRGRVQFVPSHQEEVTVPADHMLQVGPGGDRQPRRYPLAKLLRNTSVWGRQYELWQLVPISPADLLRELAAPRLRLGLDIAVTAEPGDGLEVATVVAGSPAAAAGVQPGDRLVAVAGQAVATLVDVAYGEIRLASCSGPAITIRRGGQVRTVQLPRKITSGQLDSGESAAMTRITNLLAEYRIDEAAALAREETEQEPGHPGGWFNLGLIEEHRGRYREALNCYQQAAELAPGSAVVLSATGRAYAQLGNANRAIASLTEAVQLREDPETNYLLGRVALLTGNLPLAERLARQLLESPESVYQAWGHTLEGTILRVVNESLEPAAEHFQTALSLCPSNLHAAHSLAGTLLALGRVAEAKQVAEALATIQPHSLRVVNRMGAIAYRQKSWQEAERWFQRAERLQVFPPLTAYNVASVYAAQGNNEQAVHWYRLALTRDASFVPAHVYLARSLDQQGKWLLALRHLHQALQIDPGDQPAYNRLADLWKDHGRLDRARRIALHYGLQVVPGQS